MILFFGTRTGKTEIQQLAGVVCPHCEQLNTLIISKTGNWFHLFWFKLFRISTQVAAECSHCKRVYFEEEFSKEMRQGQTNLKE